MQVWCCWQVTLCDPHLSALEVRFSRRGAIQIDVYLILSYRCVYHMLLTSRKFMTYSIPEVQAHNHRHEYCTQLAYRFLRNISQNIHNASHQLQSTPSKSELKQESWLLPTERASAVKTRMNGLSCGETRMAIANKTCVSGKN